MSDAPERITAAYRDGFHSAIRWTGGVSEFWDTEYVRADLYATLEAERDRLRLGIEMALHKLEHDCREQGDGMVDILRAALEGSE